MRRPLRLALGVVVFGAAPVARVCAIHQGYGIRAGALTAVAVAAVAALEGLSTRRRPGDAEGTALSMLAGVAVVAGVLAAAAGGRIVGPWVAATTVLAAWTAVGWRLPVLPRFDVRSLPPVAGISLLAARAALDGDRLAWALGWTVVAGLVALVLAPRGEQVVRAVEALTRGLRRGLTVVLLTPVWVLAALVPWAFQRLFRVDPLRGARGEPRRNGSAWIARRPGVEAPDRLWLEDPAALRPALLRRAHALLPGLVAVALVAAGVVAWVRHEPDDGPDLPPAAELAVDESGEIPPLFREVIRNTNDAIANIWFSQYAGNEWSDTTSTHLNIEDGRRRTWRSDRCAAPDLTVWMFGGSTLFGTNQRDDFTLPSTLAKLADREGVILHVENFGMVGDVAWQEARRLERALASGEAPDVVVFYDGWNDLRAVLDMDFTGRSGQPQDFIGPMDRLQERILSDLDGLEPGTTRRIEVPVPGTGLDQDDAVDLAVRSYERADRTARLLTADAGVDFLHVYQPSIHTRSPRPPGDLESDPAARAPVLAFRDALPQQIVDLSDVIRPDDGLIYLDEVHLIEPGNAPVAAAILDELAPQIDAALAARPEGASCP